MFGSWWYSKSTSLDRFLTGAEKTNTIEFLGIKDLRAFLLDLKKLAGRLSVSYKEDSFAELIVSISSWAEKQKANKIKIRKMDQRIQR